MRSGKITFTKEITAVPYRAFANCTDLTAITLPDYVTKISVSSFYNCTNLTNINLDNINTYGTCAFQNCSSLTSITLSKYLTLISLMCFMGCTSLTSVSIPSDSNITKICKYAFKNCKSLTSFTLNDNITTIEDQAFYGCKSLTEIIYQGVKYTNTYLLSLAFKKNNITFGSNLFTNTGIKTTRLQSEIEYTTLGDNITNVSTNGWDSSINGYGISIDASNANAIANKCWNSALTYTFYIDASTLDPSTGESIDTKVKPYKSVVKLLNTSIGDSSGIGYWYDEFMLNDSSSYKVDTIGWALYNDGTITISKKFYESASSTTAFTYLPLSDLYLYKDSLKTTLTGKFWNSSYYEFTECSNMDFETLKETPEITIKYLE